MNRNRRSVELVEKNDWQKRKERVRDKLSSIAVSLEDFKAMQAHVIMHRRDAICSNEQAPAPDEAASYANYSLFQTRQSGRNTERVRRESLPVTRLAAVVADVTCFEAALVRVFDRPWLGHKCG
jgi:hypothetical protein